MYWTTATLKTTNLQARKGFNTDFHLSLLLKILNHLHKVILEQ